MTSTLELVDYARQLRALTEQRKNLDAQEAELKARIRAAIPAGGTVDDGAGHDLIRVVPNRRFDLKAGVALLPADKYAACVVQEFDPSAVKRHLTAEQVEACMAEVGQARVVIV